MPSLTNENSSAGEHVTVFKIFSLLLSIISYILAVGSDIYLAYRYYHNEQATYFQLTLTFILFPAIVNIVMSTSLYISDEGGVSVGRMASRRWIIRLFILILQLDPIVRYCKCLGYALKSRRAEKKGDYLNQRIFYELMLDEDSSKAFLKVVQCFLETAPQSVLQVTILLLDEMQAWTFQYYSQVVSICSSLLSMGWCMASYHRTIRFAEEDKDDISVLGVVVQFLWHFMVTVSRILSISVAASLFPLPTMAACSIHWLLMTTWLEVTSTKPFCADPKCSRFVQRVGNFLLYSIMALVFIFTYIMPKEDHTRNKYICYYLLCVVENITVAVVWGTTAGPVLRLKWYFYPLLVSCIVPFGLGMGFMVLHYLYFRSSTKRARLVAQTSEDVAVQVSNLGLDG